MSVVHHLRLGETGRSISHASATPQLTATWEVHDLTTGIGSSAYVVASGAAVMDTLSRSPSSAAGPGTPNPRRVSMASTTGIEVGRTYLMREGGRSELVEVAGLSTDAYVDLRHALVGSYTTAATLEGVTMLALLPDEIAATTRYADYDEPLRIVWTYANGERHQQQIRVVRQDHSDHDKAGVLKKLRSLYPNIVSKLSDASGDHLGDLVDMVRDMVHAEILADGERPETRLLGDQGEWAVTWRVLLHLAAQGLAPGTENTDVDRWVQHCQRMADRYWSPHRIGQAGARTVKVDPPSQAAVGGTDDKTYRSPIRWY